MSWAEGIDIPCGKREQARLIQCWHNRWVITLPMNLTYRFRLSGHKMHVVLHSSEARPS